MLLPLALVSEAGYLFLYRLRRLDVFVDEFLTVFFAVSLFYLVACWHTSKNCPASATRRDLVLILLMGMVFRFTLAPLEPSLTEDPYRYRWNARLAAAGGNPYREHPSDPRWTSLRDATWPKVTGKDLASPYGPILEWSYRLTYTVVSRLTSNPFRQVLWFKFPFALADLATGAVLLALLRRLGLAPGAIVVYFWSPLVITEFWASGHNDSVLLLLLVAGLYAASLQRWFWSSGAWWAAFLVKFWPALLFPHLLLSGGLPGLRRRAVAAASWLPVVAVIGLSYWSSYADLRWTLAGFLGGWTNNASLFHFLYAAAGRDFEQTRSFMGLLVAGAALACAALRLPLVQGLLWTITALLLLSANCFPWYLTWLVPLLALEPVAPLLLWTALAPLAYHVLPLYAAVGQWREDPSFLYLEYVPVYAMLLATPWLARYGRSGGRPPALSAGSPLPSTGGSMDSSPVSPTIARP